MFTPPQWRLRFKNDETIYYAINFIMGSTGSVDGVEYVSEDGRTFGERYGMTNVELLAYSGCRDRDNKPIYERDLLTLYTPTGHKQLRVVRIGAEFFVKTPEGATYYLNEFNTSNFQIQSDTVLNFIMS